MCRLFFHHHHHHQTRIVWFIKPASWRICASRCVCVFVCTPITHSLRQCCLLLCLLPNPFCFPFCWCQSGGCFVFAWIFLCLFWSISIGQIELVSSGRHARGTGTCSGLYMAQPSGNVLLKLLFSSARDAKDASSPADLPCLRLFRLFIYLSFSLTAFCLQENDRLSLPLCFVASFFYMQLSFFYSYTCIFVPLFFLPLFTAPLGNVLSPKWHWAPFTSSLTLLLQTNGTFYIASDRLSHRQSSPLHK